MCYWKADHVLLRIACLLLAIGVVSCESEKPPAAFYPIDSLITAQANRLTNLNAGLFKEALLSGKTDTMTYRPETDVAWMNELEAFRKLDIINKPVNKGSYLVNDGLVDPESNLTIRAFTSLKKLPVVWLKIYYQGTLSKPRKIEALFDEANLLYSSGRLVSMHLGQIEGKTVLTGYEIKGGQKMMFGDSVAFYIRGRVLFD